MNRVPGSSHKKEKVIAKICAEDSMRLWDFFERSSFFLHAKYTPWIPSLHGPQGNFKE